MTAGVSDESVSRMRQVAFHKVGGLAYSGENYGVYSDLARRMASVPKAPQEIVYEVTKDAGMIHQYCVLREEMFRRIWSLEHFSAERDAVDDNSDIMIARQGRQCIGGGRATYSTVQKRQRLPLESDDFTLANVLPELRLNACNYYEVTRVAVLPEFAKDNVVLELIGRILSRSIGERASYCFFISPMTMTRTHRRVVNRLGYTLTTRQDIEIPDREEYEGIRMHLSYVDLTAYLPLQSQPARALEMSGI